MASSDLFYKILEPMVGKKFANEVWYHYLTGEWQTPFPDELKRPQNFFNLQGNFYARLPSELHCYHCGIRWSACGEARCDSCVPRRPVSAPGCARDAKAWRATTKALRRWS